MFAVIFLVAGGVMLYFRNRTRQKSALMSQTETSSASGVAGLAPGTLVEVKGMLRCEEPLTSEFAEKTCAYYSSKVTREYMERDRHDDDDVGSNRRSEVVAQNEQFAPFAVEDDSGSVVVSAEGAEVDARQVVNHFDRNTGNEGPSISLGGATLNLGGGERTIGYRYTESILPVDESVYVLGTVQEDGGIGAPQSGEESHRFVVSHRSEEALGQSLGKTALWLGVGGAGALVLGVVLLVVGILVLLSRQQISTLKPSAFACQPGVSHLVSKPPGFARRLVSISTSQPTSSWPAEVRGNYEAWKVTASFSVRCARPWKTR